MTSLDRFLDDGTKGKWAKLTLKNGDPCWVSVARSGVVIKKSKMGMFGEKLYEEKNITKLASTAMALNELYPDDLTPDGIQDPILKAYANAVLHCENPIRVTRTLYDAEVMLAKKSNEDNLKNTNLNSQESRDLALLNKIIRDYSQTMENGPPPGCVADASQLPYPKDVIKKALIIALETEKNAEMKRVLGVAYIQLADWQEGVGEHTLGLDTSKISTTLSKQEQVKLVIKQTEGIEKWNSLVRQELEKSKSELKKIGCWEC